MSHSIVGLLDGDGLDEIYRVIELVLLGLIPSTHYVLSLIFLCLMLVTRARVP